MEQGGATGQRTTRKQMSAMKSPMFQLRNWQADRIHVSPEDILNLTSLTTEIVNFLINNLEQEERFCLFALIYAEPPRPCLCSSRLPQQRSSPEFL